MTEQLTDRTDAYGTQIGRELRALSDRAIQPFDPAKIAHAVAVGRPARLGLRIGLRLGWFRGARPLLFATLILMSALLAAFWAGAQQPPPTSPFQAGSIAFSRDGDLYVAASDGSEPMKVADGRPGSDAITNFAFSPDRRYLAFVRISDSATRAATLGIASHDGVVTDLYTGPGVADRFPVTASMIFGWAPDSKRLAVYPGVTATEISIIDIHGKPVGAVDLPSGAVMKTKYWPAFGSLAWSPDSNWLATAVQQGGEGSGCDALGDDLETCYILMATDGSGAQRSSDELSNYFAWAPDSRYAITHWYSNRVEIRRPEESSTTVVRLPGTTDRPDTLTYANDGHVLAWSPDGTLLLVAGYDKHTQRSTLSVIQADGTARNVPLDDLFTGIVSPAEWTSLGVDPDAVAWSEDGNQLLFQAAKSGSATRGIWSVDVDGGSATFIVETSGPIFDVADGRSW